MNTLISTAYLQAFVRLFPMISVVRCDSTIGTVTVYGMGVMQKLGRFLLSVDNHHMWCVQMGMDEARLMIPHGDIASPLSARVRQILWASGIFKPFVLSANKITELDTGINLHTWMFGAYSNAVLVTGGLAHETDTSRMRQLLMEMVNKVQQPAEESVRGLEDTLLCVWHSAYTVHPNRVLATVDETTEWGG